jgi:hypothetical protein
MHFVILDIRIANNSSLWQVSASRYVSVFVCCKFEFCSTVRLSLPCNRSERNLYGEGFYLLGEKVIACLDSSARYICLLNRFLPRAEDKSNMLS